MKSRLLRQLAVCLSMASVSVIAGCAGETEDADENSSEDALTNRVLKVGECAVTTPNHSTVAGVYDAPLSGCFVARGNESGIQMIDRAIAIVTNPKEIGSATHPDGSKMFESYEPGSTRGTLADGDSLSFDAKIGLDIVGPFDAKGTLRFASTRSAAGGITLRVTNTTKIGALGIAPVQPNGLEFVVTLTPAVNGVVVSGTVKVTLVSQKDSDGSVSIVAPEIVGWLKGKLGAQ